jgi:hypothetical protein
MKRSRSFKKQQKKLTHQHPTMISISSPSTPAPAGPHPDYPNLAIHAGKVYRLETKNHFTFFKEIPLPDQNLYASWSGPKIPLALWRQITAFFEESYDWTKGETQVRLYFNRAAGLWKAWAFPQYISGGMTTQEAPPDPEHDRQMAEAIGPGYTRHGSVHHHCSSSAFQSSVDRTNEHGQDGLHITVGHIGKDLYDLHGRVVIGAQQYEVVWPEWFESPPNVESAITSISAQVEQFKEWSGLFPIPTDWDTNPASLRNRFVQWVLKQPATEPTEIPDQWMNNLLERPATNYHAPNFPPSGNGQAGLARLGRHSHGYTYTAPQYIQDIPKHLEEMVEDLLDLQVAANISDFKAEALMEGIAIQRRSGDDARKEWQKPNGLDEHTFVDEATLLINRTKDATGESSYLAFKAFLDAQKNIETHASQQFNHAYNQERWD